MNGAIMLQAFKAATDADKRAFSVACNNEDLSETIFYMVPGDWMSSFFRFIESSNALENEKPDMIGNSALLLESPSLPVVPPQSPWGSPPASIYNGQNGSGGGFMAQSDDVDDEEHVRRRVLRRQKWQERQNQPHSLEINQTIKPGMVRHKDYALVGTHVWTLLSSKFGSDFAIPRQCIRLSQPDSGDLSNVAVEVYPRDALNRSVDVSENDPCLKLVPTSGSLVHIPEQSGEGNSSVVGQGGDGMSDEDDLFPSIENDDQEAETPQVLLLPPSTTSSAGRKFALVSLESRGKDDNYLDPAKDEMEYETEDSMVDANDEAASNKRKRYAAGLGNLGNTCFMNSSLQCLAHTDPLRQYFVSGSYLRDLNRGNPLGTGGELATEFANLLTQMWGVKSKEGKNTGRSPSSNGYSSYYSANSYDSSVVYPRNFKYALGKHAEQFIGYDQHDSQELATYLLDALHEDTNRVVKKPYVEKPEQGEDESDDVAAQKAWDVHLQRDNSHVLENFMGQVKSRVQCPTEGCGRVSTTFDPFMYLSVPIPGATERSITVTYVPMNGHERMKKVVVKLKKDSTIDVLQTKVAEVVNLGKTSDDLVAPENIAITDVWSHHEVFTFLKPDEDIDKILDTDHTYAYQICSISTIHEQQDENIESPDPILETLEQEESGKQEVNNPLRLDLATITGLNRNEKWTSELERFFVKPTALFGLLKTKRSTDEERMSTYKKMESFIDRCRACREVSKENWPNVQDGDSPVAHASVDEVKNGGILSLEECSEMSSTFKGIRNIHDLAVFSYVSRKFYQHTVKLTNQRNDQLKDGIVVQIVFKSERKTHGASYSVRHQHASVGSERTILTPFVLRIHQKLSVFELRELLSKRLSRLIKPHKETATVGSMGSPRNEVGSPATIANDLSIMSNESDSKLILGKSESVTQDALTQQVTLTNSSESLAGSPESVIMRQVPLSFQRMNTYGYSKNFAANRALGSLLKDQGGMAMSTDDEEQQAVSEVVGDQGKVILHWPSNLPDLDQSEWEMRDTSDVPDEEDDTDKEKLRVSACIQKYCQMEQLEETEMWYCSRCKSHVRAWKQFHLYKTPPILIVHLKRFQFSSTTHRRNKIDAFVDFPLTGLDLTEEAMKWTEHEKPIYDCYAVSNHYGGLGGGHYTAYARGDDGVWSHFDDSRVTTTVAEDEVVSKAAYVLYYKRRDVEVGNIDELIEKASSHGPTIDDEFADALSDTSEPTTSLLYPKPPSELSLSQAAEGMVVGDETIGNSSPTCSSPMDSMEGLSADDDTGSRDDDVDSMISPNANLILLEPQ